MITCINKSARLFLCLINLNTQTMVYRPTNKLFKSSFILAFKPGLNPSKSLPTSNTIPPKVQRYRLSPTQPNCLQKKPKLSIIKARSIKPKPIPKFKLSTIYPEISPRHILYQESGP